MKSASSSGIAEDFLEDIFGSSSKVEFVMNYGAINSSFKSRIGLLYLHILMCNLTPMN